MGPGTEAGFRRPGWGALRKGWAQLTVGARLGHLPQHQVPPWRKGLPERTRTPTSLCPQNPDTMQPSRLYTLVLVLQPQRILLGMKKRGFGAGRWNGFGGKVQEGESIEDGARR